MKLLLAFFFTILSGSTLASQSYFNEIEDVSSLNNPPIQNTRHDTILSVFLYLPLFDNSNLSSVMSAAQMTVTPTITYTDIRGIYIRAHSTSNGSCAGTASPSYGIGIGFNNTVTRLANHAYETDDASDRALNHLGGSSFNPQFDTEFGLLDNTFGLIVSTLRCIAGSGSDTCTGSLNCGWNSTRSWAP